MSFYRFAVRCLTIAGAFACWSGTVPASAQGRIEIGVLECRSGPSTSFIVGSVRDLRCIFRPGPGRWREEWYVGTASRVGLDIGVSTGAFMVWSVVAPADAYGPGALAGSYAGVSAGAAVGPGLAANALIGGFGRSFALQPLSIEGQGGLNISAGLAGLELQSVR